MSTKTGICRRIDRLEIGERNFYALRKCVGSPRLVSKRARKRPGHRGNSPYVVRYRKQFEISECGGRENVCRFALTLSTGQTIGGSKLPYTPDHSWLGSFSFGHTSVSVHDWKYSQLMPSGSQRWKIAMTLEKKNKKWLASLKRAYGR